jgi:biopolymer transport protein ExbD
MLVLLIIFMVTAPLLTHAVKVDLPKAASTMSEARPEHIELSIDRDGQVFWNGQVVDATDLEARLSDAAANIAPETGNAPELRLRADRQTPYEKVAQVMSAASRHGLTRLGFVTDPSEAQAR